MNPELILDVDSIAAFCQKWKIVELAVFGSALRDDFRSDSDVDFLVTFSADADWSLFDRVEMSDELAGIVGRKVDMVSRRALERSQNWLRKKAILGQLEPLYVAAG